MQVVALVAGAGGFVASHLVKALKAQGKYVVGLDLKAPEFSSSLADEFYLRDLRDDRGFGVAVDVSEVYQLAADMGGAGYIFTGDHDGQVMHDNALINLNVLEACRLAGVPKVFFSSSACVYPQGIQTSPFTSPLKESDLLPADPDSDYGWEKLFSERLYLAYQKQYGIQVRIARFHSIVGTEGTWRGGREKVFAALARKVAEAEDGGAIEIWGDGQQTRTFLHVEDCCRGILAIMDQESSEPFNLGSEESVSITELALLFAAEAGKRITILSLPGPLGVRGRSADMTRLKTATTWQARQSLVTTVGEVYAWVERQVEEAKHAATE